MLKLFNGVLTDDGIMVNLPSVFVVMSLLVVCLTVLVVVSLLAYRLVTSKKDATAKSNCNKITFGTLAGYAFGVLGVLLYFAITLIVRDQNGSHVVNVVPFDLDALLDLLSEFALYLSIAVGVALVGYSVAVRNKEENVISGARRVMGGVIAGYSVGVIGILGTMKLIIKAIEGDLSGNFWLAIGLFGVAILGVVTCLVLNKYAKKATKWAALGFAVAFVAYCVVLCVVVPAEEYYAPLSGWQMTLFTLLLVALIVFLAIFCDKKAATEDNTKAIAYAAVCIGLSFALSYVKFFSLPQGGSVTFASMLPLALYSYMFGTKRGLVAGVVYGMLQFVQSPQFYQPMQMLIDYPIAFGAIGVAGLGRKLTFLKGNMIAEFAVGASIAITLRYVAHVLSGYFVFYTYTGEGYSPLAWAFLYNCFVFVDLAIVLVMGVVALSTKTMRRTIVEARG